jgi:hypothetical protein
MCCSQILDGLTSTLYQESTFHEHISADFSMEQLAGPAQGTLLQSSLKSRNRFYLEQ